MVEEIVKDLIFQKENINAGIHLKEVDLLQLYAEYSRKKADLYLNTDFSKVIEGRVTENLKRVYVDKELSDLKYDIGVLETQIKSLKRQGRMIDVKINIVRQGGEA